MFKHKLLSIMRYCETTCLWMKTFFINEQFYSKNKKEETKKMYFQVLELRMIRDEKSFFI